MKIYYIGASFLDALGLNLLKLDHVKESQKSASEQRSDCGRPVWHIGLYTYIASQLIGSTIALSKLLFFFLQCLLIYIFIILYFFSLFFLLLLFLLDYLKTQVSQETTLTSMTIQKRTESRENSCLSSFCVTKKKRRICIFICLFCVNSGLLRQEVLHSFITSYLQRFLLEQKSQEKMYPEHVLQQLLSFGLLFSVACIMAMIVSYFKKKKKKSKKTQKYFYICEKRKRKRKLINTKFVIIITITIIAEDTISLENLKLLFTRPIFIIYFSALNIITFSGLIFAIWSRWILADDNRKQNSQLFFNMKPKQMYRIVGLMFSLEGGMLASETLLLAKSG